MVRCMGMCLPAPAYEVPPCPGEGYVWVDGYWNPMGGRFYWRPGYWRAPAYFGYRGYERGYVGAYGWHGGGYDRHERERRDWGRHEYDRHEDRRDRSEGNGWRR